MARIERISGSTAHLHTPQHNRLRDLRHHIHHLRIDCRQNIGARSLEAEDGGTRGGEEGESSSMGRQSGGFEGSGKEGLPGARGNNARDDESGAHGAEGGNGEHCGAGE